jgi:broad specificity phosphatase PhoE
MSHVVLIRPGATTYDEQNRVQGVLDLPLSERGRAEVAHLVEELSLAPECSSLGALYCGPGENVVRTAESVGRVLGIRPRRIDELHNLDQGLWQGLQIDEIKRRNTRVFRQWIEDPRTICPPQGETVEVAMERIHSVLKPLLRRHQGESIGLVLGEPLARFVSCYLRREPRLQLDELPSCCGYERIDVKPEQLRSGNP